MVMIRSQRTLIEDTLKRELRRVQERAGIAEAQTLEAGKSRSSLEQQLVDERRRREADCTALRERTASILFFLVDEY